MDKKCVYKFYSVELWVRGEYDDTFDAFEVLPDDLDGVFALQCAKEDVEYRDQEWWDENYGWDDESLIGFTNWEIRILKRGGGWNGKS